jgi:hypothetical protein
LERDLGSWQSKMRKISVQGVGDDALGMVLVRPRSGEYRQGMLRL